MAPKEKKTVDKAKAAAKAKVVEDKTFGLKNKNKSSKVQKYVQNLQQTVTNKPPKAVENKIKDKKKAEEDREKELAALFAVAIKQPKVPPGVDPKSIVCEYFRHGQCTKGFKCKFSHDLNVERKGPKIDLYTDQRDKEDEEGGMEDWDQETLEKVVKDKHGSEKPSNKTEIICKFFLEAVEKKQYGWFWKCPNGGECKYRHALPAGYVLKSQMKELLEEEARNVKDMADIIEEERAKVDAKTPITEQVFREWRDKKIQEKVKRLAEQEDERRRKGILNGREIFLQDGFEAADDASAADDYSREDGDEEARINDMYRRAQQDAERARLAALQDLASSGAAGDAESLGESAPRLNGSAARAGDSSAGPSGTAIQTTLQLNAADADELFDEDDDEDIDDDELDDDELDGLEEHVKQSLAAS